MAYIPRSSFVPKDAPGAIPQRIQKRTTIHVFNVLATTLLFVAFVSAVGVYFYKDYSSKELDRVREELLSTQDETDAQKMDEIHAYDAKLRLASNILDAHIAPSQIFEVIEDVTKYTVQFSKLDFTYDPGFDATLSLNGNTDNFASVVLQKMQLHKDTIFSELAVRDIRNADGISDEEGSSKPQNSVASPDQVTFDVTGLFLEDVLAYKGSVIPLAEEDASSTPVTVSSDPANEITE